MTTVLECMACSNIRREGLKGLDVPLFSNQGFKIACYLAR